MLRRLKPVSSILTRILFSQGIASFIFGILLARGQERKSTGLKKKPSTLSPPKQQLVLSCSAPWKCVRRLPLRDPCPPGCHPTTGHHRMLPGKGRAQSRCCDCLGEPGTVQGENREAASAVEPFVRDIFCYMVCFFVFYFFNSKVICGAPIIRLWDRSVRFPSSARRRLYSK